jgi:hypothetical protein
MTTTENECVGYARECVRLAGLTEDPVLRDQLLDIAGSWMAAAMHEGGRVPQFSIARA